jgi:hypothetical protein
LVEEDVEFNHGKIIPDVLKEINEAYNGVNLPIQAWLVYIQNGETTIA